MFLVSRNGNNILIWSWNNSYGGMQPSRYFQENIYKIFKGFNMVRVYIYDVLVMNKNDLNDHIKALDTVLQRLSEAGLNVNPENLLFGQT